MRNGEWEMANGIMKWEIENRKLIFFFNFSLRFIVNSEEQMFFIHIHVLFLKHLRAKFKERNKLIIRKKVSLDEQTMFKDKYTRICSRKIEAIVFHVVQIFCNACEKWLQTAYCFLCAM